MEIIKKGKIKKQKEVVIFKCDDCGTKFRCDIEECTPIKGNGICVVGSCVYKVSHENAQSYYHYDCPTCGNDCIERKIIKIKNK